MNCFFYIAGNRRARLHRDRVVEACTEFLNTQALANRAWVVDQEIDGDVNVGLNLEGDAGQTFERDVIRVLEFLRPLANEIDVSFLAGTDGEDRISIDPKADDDLTRDAAFLSSL